MGVRPIAVPSQVGKSFSLTTAEKGYANILLTQKANLTTQLQTVNGEIEKVCEEINARVGLPPGTGIELKGDKVVVVSMPKAEGNGEKAAPAAAGQPSGDAPPAAEEPAAAPTA